MKTAPQLEEIIEKVAKMLLRKKQTIAVAESVTSGNIQAALSRAEKAALFYQGGMTVYNIGQKCRQLNVDPIHAESCNAVSQKVADQLSLNINLRFLSDYGIGITGYATPFPEIGLEDLFAYVSISKGNRVIASKKIKATAGGSALQVQLFYTLEVMALLHQALKEEN